MKVITFGEIMLRLAPPDHQRFVQADRFDATYGGAEANVAVMLAQWGFDSHYITKLPTHALGQAALNHLQRYGVRCDRVVRGGDRLGVYFLEQGAGHRPSQVIYDRADAAITTLRPADIDWKAVFDGAAWFHWTGITPALGEHARACVAAACRAAQAVGATVSCDLNYRAKLWTPETAQAAMVPLMDSVDVCMASTHAAEDCLGVVVDTHGAEGGPPAVDAALDVAHTLKRTFGFEAVSMTLRAPQSVRRHQYQAVLLDDAACADTYTSPSYTLNIVDRVGGGDAFAGGLIAGLLRRADSREALDGAVAASVLKHTIPGDANLATETEVDRLMQAGEAGPVER
jgi:2-dehydro-3-deoxygluconokinase